MIEMNATQLTWKNYMTGTLHYAVYDNGADVVIVCHGTADGAVHGAMDAWNYISKNVFDGLRFANSEAEAMELIAQHDAIHYICCYSSRVASKYGVEPAAEYDEEVVFIQESYGFRFYGRSENKFM